MKNFSIHHIMSRVFNTPLLILPKKLIAIEAFLAARMSVDIAIVNEDEEFDLDQEIELRARKPMHMIGNIAVIDVFGSLVHRGGFMDSSGLTSFDALENELNVALGDRDTNGILFRIDSPGGEVSGVFDFVDRVKAAGRIKPTLAMVEDMAASGAFLVASAANEIVASQGALTGSIGVILTHVDQSEFDKGMGLKITHITAGARKADGSPHIPLTDESLSELQSTVNTMMDFFVGKVAQFRGLTEAEVRGTEAGMFIGEQAQRFGLVDAIGPMELALDKIQNAVMLGGQGSQPIQAQRRNNMGFEDLEVKATETKVGEFLTIDHVFQRAENIQKDKSNQRIAMGPGGYLASSPDGKEWMERSLPKGIDCSAATFGSHDGYLSVESGDDKFYTPDAGKTWLQIIAPVPEASVVESSITLEKLGELRTVCEAAGIDQSFALDLIDTGIDAETIGRLIHQVKAKVDAASSVDGTHAPETKTNGDTLMAEVHKIADRLRAAGRGHGGAGSELMVEANKIAERLRGNASSQ